MIRERETIEIYPQSILQIRNAIHPKESGKIELDKHGIPIITGEETDKLRQDIHDWLLRKQNEEQGACVSDYPLNPFNISKYIDVILYFKRQNITTLDELKENFLAISYIIVNKKKTKAYIELFCAIRYMGTPVFQYILQQKNIPNWELKAVPGAIRFWHKMGFKFSTIKVPDDPKEKLETEPRTLYPATMKYEITSKKLKKSNQCINCPNIPKYLDPLSGCCFCSHECFHFLQEQINKRMN
jgi:hypothetical protein